jgi:hypothetical protein
MYLTRKMLIVIIVLLAVYIFMQRVNHRVVGPRPNFQTQR